MKRCWQHEPESRPTFDIIYEELQTMAEFLENLWPAPYLMLNQNSSVTSQQNQNQNTTSMVKSKRNQNSNQASASSNIIFLKK